MQSHSDNDNNNQYSENYPFQDPYRVEDLKPEQRERDNVIRPAIKHLMEKFNLNATGISKLFCAYTNLDWKQNQSVYSSYLNFRTQKVRNKYNEIHYYPMLLPRGYERHLLSILRDYGYENSNDPVKKRHFDDLNHYISVNDKNIKHREPRKRKSEDNAKDFNHNFNHIWAISNILLVGDELENSTPQEQIIASSIQTGEQNNNVSSKKRQKNVSLNENNNNLVKEVEKSHNLLVESANPLSENMNLLVEQINQTFQHIPSMDNTQFLEFLDETFSIPPMESPQTLSDPNLTNAARALNPPDPQPFSSQLFQPSRQLSASKPDVNPNRTVKDREPSRISLVKSRDAN